MSIIIILTSGCLTLWNASLLQHIVTCQLISLAGFPTPQCNLVHSFLFIYLFVIIIYFNIWLPGHHGTRSFRNVFLIISVASSSLFYPPLRLVLHLQLSKGHALLQESREEVIRLTSLLENSSDGTITVLFNKRKVASTCRV